MLNNYLTDNYNKLKDMAFNIAKKRGEDLLSFVIEELYKCDQKRINEIIKKKQMTFYIARVMVNQYYSKTSRYYKKYKQYYEYHISGIIESISPDNSQTQIEDRELMEERLEWIEKELKKLHWFDSEVFKIYYKNSHSLNSLSEATKINRNTIYHSINKVKKHLKNGKI
jgi:DNA-directed RNA polymerase specialized sigma24 family protein